MKLLKFDEKAYGYTGRLGLKWSWNLYTWYTCGIDLYSNNAYFWFMIIVLDKDHVN